MYFAREDSPKNTKQDMPEREVCGGNFRTRNQKHFKTKNSCLGFMKGILEIGGFSIARLEEELRQCLATVQRGLLLLLFLLLQRCVKYWPSESVNFELVFVGQFDDVECVRLTFDCCSCGRCFPLLFLALLFLFERLLHVCVVFESTLDWSYDVLLKTIINDKHNKWIMPNIRPMIT